MNPKAKEKKKTLVPYIVAQRYSFSQILHPNGTWNLMCLSQNSSGCLCFYHFKTNSNDRNEFMQL